jgi:rhodanese-related sulfurtransferase
LPDLTIDEADAAVAGGAALVDVRSVDAFAAGHVPGSVSIPWRAQFATWLGWLVPRDQPVVFIVDDTVDRAALVWAAYTIGYEQLSGELAGGIAAWRAGGRQLSSTRLVGPGGTDGRQVVDIRQRSEFAAGHVPGALHVELGRLTADTQTVPSGPVLVHCGHSERAMSAASLLERAGHQDVVVLVGGPADLGDLEVEA